MLSKRLKNSEDPKSLQKVTTISSAVLLLLPSENKYMLKNIFHLVRNYWAHGRTRANNCLDVSLFSVAHQVILALRKTWKEIKSLYCHYASITKLPAAPSTNFKGLIIYKYSLKYQI